MFLTLDNKVFQSLIIRSNNFNQDLFGYDHSISAKHLVNLIVKQYLKEHPLTTDELASFHITSLDELDEVKHETVF